MRKLFGLIAASVVIGLATTAGADNGQIIVSVADQELALVANGKTVARYPVSTSKFGLGDGVGTYRTPLGELFVSEQLGDGLPAGAVIRSRLATGEVIAPNAAAAIRLSRACSGCAARKTRTGMRVIAASTFTGPRKSA